jgi:hypothetical protein
MVFGKDLAIERGSLILVSRGESVELSEKEMDRSPVKLSEQRKINRRLLEASEEINRTNSGECGIIRSPRVPHLSQFTVNVGGGSCY